MTWSGVLDCYGVCVWAPAAPQPLDVDDVFVVVCVLVAPTAPQPLDVDDVFVVVCVFWWLKLLLRLLVFWLQQLLKLFRLMMFFVL